VHYPCLKINLSKVENNIRIINGRCATSGISVVGVSKCFFGDAVIAGLFKKNGIKIFGDSRILNLIKLRKHFGPAQDLYMLRTPMITEVKELAGICNTSMNTQRETVKAISGQCQSLGKRHKIIVMVETDDRREGLLPEQVLSFCAYVQKNCRAIDMLGIGTNARCITNKRPKRKSLELLVELKEEIEHKLGINIQVVSGGNSSIWDLIENDDVPSGINQVRIGEAILLGHETAQYKAIKGTYSDAFILEAEIIETKKRSGGSASYRAIAALGLQDVYFKNIKAAEPPAVIESQSSDHSVIETAVKIKTGDIISFKPDYFGILSCMSSPFVKKVYII